MRILGSVRGIERKVSFSSWSSCLPFPRAGLLGQYHYAWVREKNESLRVLALVSW